MGMSTSKRASWRAGFYLLIWWLSSCSNNMAAEAVQETLAIATNICKTNPQQAPARPTIMQVSLPRPNVLKLLGSNLYLAKLGTPSVRLRCHPRVCENEWLLNLAGGYQIQEDAIFLALPLFLFSGSYDVILDNGCTTDIKALALEVDASGLAIAPITSGLCKVEQHDSQQLISMDCPGSPRVEFSKSMCSMTSTNSLGVKVFCPNSREQDIYLANENRICTFVDASLPAEDMAGLLTIRCTHDHNSLGDKRLVEYTVPFAFMEDKGVLSEMKKEGTNNDKNLGSGALSKLYRKFSLQTGVRDTSLQNLEDKLIKGKYYVHYLHVGKEIGMNYLQSYDHCRSLNAHICSQDELLAVVNTTNFTHPQERGSSNYWVSDPLCVKPLSSSSSSAKQTNFVPLKEAAVLSFALGGKVKNPPEVACVSREALNLPEGDVLTSMCCR